MEDKEKIGGPADELQFCSVTESRPPQYILTKPSKSVKWHLVLLAFVAALVIALVVMASYLVAKQHDCDVYLDENDRDDLPWQHHPPNEYNRSLTHSVETLTVQERTNLEFVSRLDCLQVNGVLKRLGKQVRIDDISNFDSVEKLKLHEYLLARISQLRCNVDDEVNALEIAGENDDREIVCQESYVGDGWCDLSCNNEKYDFDGGDCCFSSCVAKSRELPCGINGYACDMSVATTGPPDWFTQRTQLCYQWYADGDGGQCGGGASQRLCAYVNQFTNYYRDDTDGRAGGCRMSWGVFAPSAESWFNEVQLCYTWYADGDGGQCTARARELCASVNSYTDYYRDDTDGRSGGCRMSWQLRLPAGAPSWMYNVRLCYRWYPDGDGGQCGGGVSTNLCAYTGLWTPFYRDDTDGRSGGCQMKWGLFL